MRSARSLLYALPALLAVRLAAAGSGSSGDNCSVSDNRLEVGTYAFYSDCDTYTYCDQASSTCKLKECRKDEYPYGYPQDYQHLPQLCKGPTFCPDEQDQCQPLLTVDSPCQFNRDDQCEPPPNWQDLADTSGRGLNNNGSVCLNNVCMWANGTAGQSCVVENTAFIAYAGTQEFIDIVSRGNCKLGLYCDAQQLQCVQQKDIGASCDADKECSSFNCEANGVCGHFLDAPVHVAMWVYIIVALLILAGMIGTLIGLYFIHRKRRDEEREKRRQYWREQNTFRQNILQMRETARASILSLGPQGGGSARSTLYSRDGSSEDSQLPMLQHAAVNGNKTSGLRHAYSDDGNYSDDGLTAEQPRRVEPRDNRF